MTDEEFEEKHRASILDEVGLVMRRLAQADFNATPAEQTEQRERHRRTYLWHLPNPPGPM